MKKEMTWHEVSRYYGRSYKKIIEALKITVETFSYEVDTFCGKYLELECTEQNNKGRWFKVNHGISNVYPYNVWYRPGKYQDVIREHFKTQAEVVEFIKKTF